MPVRGAAAPAATLEQMATFIATVIVFGLAVLAMALGVLLQGRRLQGSCGGTGKACECSPRAARRCELRRQLEAARGADVSAPPDTQHS